MTTRVTTCLAVLLVLAGCKVESSDGADAAVGAGGSSTPGVGGATGTGGSVSPDAGTPDGAAGGSDAGTTPAADTGAPDASGSGGSDAATEDATPDAETDATADSNDSTPLTIVRISGSGCSVDAPTRWTRAIYVVTCDLSVESSLTIDPGVIVKFGDGNQLGVAATGTLNATGTAAAPIIFTSIKDDAHGGDSVGDGPTTPSKNDWGCFGTCGDIGIGGNSSVLDHVQLLNGHNGLWVQASSVQVKNSVFAHQGESGVVLDSRFPSESTTLTGNAFFDNGSYPLVLGKAISVDASNIFHDPANPATKNVKQCINVDANTVNAAISFGVTELAFLADFDIASALTVADGVIFKTSMGGRIDVTTTGTLVNGSKAIFTSQKDDSVGGDCMGDGATPPAVGDWEGVYIGRTSDSDWAAASANIRYASKSGTIPL